MKVYEITLTTNEHNKIVGFNFIGELENNKPVLMVDYEEYKEAMVRIANLLTENSKLIYTLQNNGIAVEGEG